MTLKVANQIVETALDSGWEAELCEDYSGRGMFGKTTAGIVIPDVMTFAAAVGGACLSAVENDADGDAEEIIKEVKGARQDSMGLDIIFY